MKSRLADIIITGGPA